jgi:hypothetical protein
LLPRSLELRTFSPALPDTPILLGMSSDRPNPHAETFARLLREAAQDLAKSGGVGQGKRT